MEGDLEGLGVAAVDASAIEETLLQQVRSCRRSRRPRATYTPP